MSTARGPSTSSPQATPKLLKSRDLRRSYAGFPVYVDQTSN